MERRAESDASGLQLPTNRSRSHGRSTRRINDALSSFANPLIWLIGVAIMISGPRIKTGLGARIAYAFVAVFGKRTLGIGYALALAMIFRSARVVDPTTTAFLGLGVLLLTGILEWKDVLQEKSARDTIVWLSALVMMATFRSRQCFP